MPIAERSAQHITGLTKMKKKDKNNSTVSNFIILILSIITIFIEAIIVLISSFNKGILKREILSKRTDLGFDLIIRRK